jgi:PhnB protein
LLVPKGRSVIARIPKGAPMSDAFDPVRRLRPDRVEPDDPADPAVLSRAKERLMSTIDQDHDPTTTLATPDVYPRLAYEDELAAVAYLTRVFGFTEIREARLEFGGHHLCWLRMGTGLVMLGHANPDVHLIHSPREAGLTTVMVNVYVPDVDAHYARAVTEGAEVTMDLDDAFFGERRYEATDLEGHRWHFAERFDDIRARGGREPEPGEPPAG